MFKFKFGLFLSIMLCVSVLSVPNLNAEEASGLSTGQMIYVPAYSHIYSGDRAKPFLLTVTLSIRNIDLKHAITVTAVDYYETQGALLKSFLEKPITLKPLASIRYIIPEQDKAGGSGANFIVTWESCDRVNAPVVEAVMIGTQSQQGVSFTSRGQVVVPVESME